MTRTALNYSWYLFRTTSQANDADASNSSSSGTSSLNSPDAGVRNGKGTPASNRQGIPLPLSSVSNSDEAGDGGAGGLPGDGGAGGLLGDGGAGEPRSVQEVDMISETDDTNNGGLEVAGEDVGDSDIADATGNH